MINFLKLTYTWTWNGKVTVLPGNDGIVTCVSTVWMDQTDPSLELQNIYCDSCEKSQRRSTVELVLRGFGKIDVGFLFFIFWPFEAFCGLPKRAKEILCRRKS